MTRIGEQTCEGAREPGFDLGALANVPVLDLRLIIRPGQHLELGRYSGSALRGVFGRALMKAACLRGGECERCLCPEDCLYHQLFDTEAPLELGSNRGSSEVPRPFVLVPPNGGRLLPAGQRASIGLRLFGPATEQLSYFLYALEEAGRHGLGPHRIGYRVLAAEVAGAGGDRRPFYDGETFLLEPRPARLSDWAPGASDERAELLFKTPVRLKHRGQLVTEELEFHVLVRSLLRRLDLLATLYGSGPLQLDFRRLVALAGEVRLTECDLRWYDWGRTSSRQKRSMRMGGLLGRVRYEGDLAPFWPLLGAGRVAHVGKATTFGLGSFSLVGVTWSDIARGEDEGGVVRD